MPFDYHIARSLPEAIALNAAYPDHPVLAGGTDLIVQWRAGAISPTGIIDISHVAELKSIVDDDDSITIGACAVHADIAKNEGVLKYIPLLAKACLSIGAVQIQNRGTIGGNIMNASPAGDALPAILAYDAELGLQDVKGERWIPARDFFVGYRKTAKGPHELLTRIRFLKQLNKGEKSEFYKIGTRRAQAISKVVMCVRGAVDHGAMKDIAIAVGSVAPTAVRAYGTETLIRGKIISEQMIEQARRSLADEVHPIDDVRSTADYRRFICGSLIARFLRSARHSKQ